MRVAARWLQAVARGRALAEQGAPAMAPGGAPRSVTLAGERLESCQYSAPEELLWIRFPNQSRPRELVVSF